MHDGEIPLKVRLPGLCQQSEALYQICITLQVSIRPDLKSEFFEYFDAALNKFRSELDRSEAYLEDGFWRQYCRNQSMPDPSEQYDVEVMSGLPRSLVDIFSCIYQGATEQDFWDWPGSRGCFLQCQLWEAYRLAGMLVIRHGAMRLPFELDDNPAQRGRSQRQSALPTTAVIITRLLSCVDAIYRASSEAGGKVTLIINAIPYPVFVAGLQTDALNKDPDLREFIRKILVAIADGPFWNKQYRLLLELLEEYWTYPQNTINIHQIAQSRGIELGLF
ncbi:C6 finger domain protein [Aspergillus luchuensis]|uniref:C6 finger domain protein n=1 Tax=Aspergillus kawachii TaxID=1069201 RepID=A0A146FVW2_ASPKA|nr:C6 finger domain protein [Aspergillus luchuensis]